MRKWLQINKTSFVTAELGLKSGDIETIKVQANSEFCEIQATRKIPTSNPPDAMKNSFKSLLPVAAVAVFTLASAHAQVLIDGQSLRRVESAVNNATTFGQTTDNQGRTGIIGSTPNFRHTITTVAFNLNTTTAVRTAFENATQFTFTFNLTDIVNGTVALPSLNVEYVGTFSNAYSSNTVWNSASVATWSNVAVFNTPAQTFTLSTTDSNFSGTIDITSSSAQFAIFRLALSDRTYMDTTNRNYVFSNTASDYDFVAIPEPATWGLLAAGLTALLILRRRAS
jgi:hypothetical protein